MCSCYGLIFSRILAVFFHSAKAATAPVSDVACSSYEVAKMSGHVTSQTSGRPDFHGAIMTPSGHLPSERDRSAGSKIDGIRATIKDI